MMSKKKVIDTGVIRKFNSGATRNTSAGKNDYEGFISPLVIESYGNYMHKHRIQSDGSLRDSDNWTKGMPLNVYIKSAWRHFLDLWFLHRGYNRISSEDGHTIDLEEALMALLFNIMGYAYEILKGKKGKKR